jgi:hypothetical protein
MLFGMEIRESGWPELPVRSLTVSFGAELSTLGDLRLPVRSFTGSFGGLLEEKLPVRALTAAFTSAGEFLTVAGTQPTRTIEANFGGILSGTEPVRSFTASLSSNAFTLDKRLQVWELDASLTEPQSFSLNAKIPMRIASISIEAAAPSLSLSVSIPGALSFQGSLREADVGQLDSNVPVWRLTSAMYDPSMSVDVNIPVWIVENALDARIQNLTRFSDYVLRYERP